MKLEDSIDVVENAEPTVMCGYRETKAGTRLYFEAAFTRSSNETSGSTRAVRRAGSTLMMDVNDSGLFADGGGDRLSRLDILRNEPELLELKLATLLKGMSCSYPDLNDLESCDTAS